MHHHPHHAHRRISRSELSKVRLDVRGARRKPNPFIHATPASYQLQHNYDPPNTWKRAINAPIPSDITNRAKFIECVQELAEDALIMRKPVLRDVSRLCNRIKKYHLENRERIVKYEHMGRHTSEQFFLTHARLRFLLYGAAWNSDKTCATDFKRLCCETHAVTLDRKCEPGTPIYAYKLSTLRFAIVKLVKEWNALEYSDELVSYVDHLHRRVCTFLSGTFPSSVLNFNGWSVREHRDERKTSPSFLTEMDIYLSSLRIELYQYERIRSHKAGGGAHAYRALPNDVLRRAKLWLEYVATKEVYQQFAVEKLSALYIDTCILPGERELYSHKNNNDDGNMTYPAQSIISAFRAAELEIVEETANLSVARLLDPMTLVGEAPGARRARGDRSRELIFMCVLQFYFKSKFAVDFEDTYWIEDKHVFEHDGAIASAAHTASLDKLVHIKKHDMAEYVPSEGTSGVASAFERRIVSAAQRSHPLGAYDKHPVLINLFHQPCVFLYGSGAMMCPHDPVSAICCWIELMVTRLRTKIPRLVAIYEHIFNGADYTENTREAREKRIYGEHLSKVSIWKSGDDNDND